MSRILTNVLPVWLWASKWRADTSEKEVTPKNSNYKKEGGRERGRRLCLRELKWASHWGFGSESNNSLHQLMLTWAANKWGPRMNPVISHNVSTLLSQRLSEGGEGGGSRPPLSELCVCVCVCSFCCSALLAWHWFTALCCGTFGCFDVFFRFPWWWLRKLEPL